MSNFWLVVFALTSESAGVMTLFSDISLPLALAGYLSAHALASAALTLVLMVVLPARYRNAKLRSALFLFTLQFAIPFLGSLGVFAGVLLALYLPRTAREVPWQEVAIPELPFQPLDLDQMVIYSEGGLRQVLREAGDPDKRLQALLATRQMTGREGVDILQEALKDPSDDVRLLAYSMLEQREKILAAEAGQLKQSLEQSDGPGQQMWQRRLAQIWWEMAYLGLAQGSLRQYYLENAQELLLTLAANYDMHNDWRLLGRVELALGRDKQAQEAFEIAMDNGAPAEMILPYLAEIAFRERNFQKVRYCLARCTHHRSHPRLSAVMEAWL